MVYGNDNHEYNYACDMMCNKCYNVTNWEANHNMIEVAAKESTCTENGNVKYFYCEYCNYCEDEDGNFTNMMNVKLDLAPHEYWTPCDGRCKNCYEITNPEAACSLIHVEALDPTCTEMGNKEYWYCEYCNACWENADGSGFQSNYRILMLAALGHKYNYDCDEICYVCGEITREDAEHLLDHIEATDPTCTKTGNIEYWYCEYCSKNFNENGIIITTDVVIPANGHEYEVECDPVCLVCKAINPDAAHDIVHVAAKAPTCTEAGNIEHWYCSYCEIYSVNSTLTANTSAENVVLAALGHTDAANDGVCDVCKEFLTTEALLKALYALSTDATLGKYTLTGVITAVSDPYSTQYKNITVIIVVDGYTQYPVTCYRVKGTGADKIGVGDTITVTGTLLDYKGTKEFTSGCTIDAYTIHEHDFNATVVEPKCTAKGYTNNTCKLCGLTNKTDEVDALGHTTEDGVCERCGEEISSDVVLVNKTYSHTMSSGQLKSGTNTLSGEKWTLALTGSTYIGWDSNNGKGIQLGSKNSPASKVTLTSEEFSNVTKIVINASGASGVNCKLVVKVGDTVIGTKTLTTSATNYTFEVDGSLTGPIVIEYQNSGKGLYIKSIKVDYAEAE